MLVLWILYMLSSRYKQYSFLIGYTQLVSQDRCRKLLEEITITIHSFLIVSSDWWAITRISVFAKSMNITHNLNYTIIYRSLEQSGTKLSIFLGYLSGKQRSWFIIMIIMMKKLIALLSILALANSFTFLYPNLQVDNSTINTVTTYKFDVNRNLDSDLNPTPYDTQLVPAGSTIIVTFPNQFNLTLTLPSCTQLLINDIKIPTLQYTYSKSANSIIISGAIPNALAIASASITISNVTNPYPALTTDPFIIKIGSDVSAQSTTVTLTKADFAACSINFSPAIVNSTAAMIINLSPNNPVLVNGEIKIQFPSNLQWKEDLSTTHPLPIASSTCSVISGQLQSGSCVGTASTTVVLFTVSSISSSKIILPFSFQINGLFSPPTTTPPDTLTITSLSPDGYQIDSCISSITGLIPQTLSLSIVPNTLPLYVSSSTTLTITFTTLDTLAKTDYFRLIFPTGTNYAFSAVTSPTLLMFTSGASYFPANLTLLMRQSSTSPSRNSGTTCRIIISNYTAPPSIKPTSDFIFQVLSGQNGLKMQGKTTLTASAQSYVLTVTPGSFVINYATSYTFTIQFLNSITNLGYITITFPIDLTLNLPSNCLTANFTFPNSPICSVNSTTVKLSNLSNATITSNTYSLTLSSISNPNKVVTSLSFSANFYYIDDPAYLVGSASFTGLTYLANQLNINSTQVVLTNYEVLQSPISLNLTFVLKDPVPASGFAVIVIPPQISIVTGYIPQCLLMITTSQAASCSITGNIFNISLGSSSIPLGQRVSIILNNFGTNPKSTRPTKTLQIYIYASGNYLINYLNSSLTITNFTPAPFLFISASPTDLTNSASTTYTFNLQQFAMWDAGAYLLIELPFSMAVGASLACRNSNTNTNLTCLSNGTIITVYLTANGSSLSLTISQIINPASLRPTSTLKITSYTSDGYKYSTDSSIIVTNNNSSTFLNFSYTFSNRIYNQTSNLILNIVNHASITSSYRLSNIAQFNNLGNISCLALGLPVLCTLSASNLIITANSTFPIATDITILNLFIPMVNITSLTLQSFDSTYLMSTFTPLSFQTLCNLPCYTCQAATPNICQSCYPTLQFTSSIYFYQNSCLSLCPASTYANTVNNQCQSCTSSCAQCTSTSFTCTQCYQNSSLPVLLLSNNTCITACPLFTYPNLSTNTTKYTPICSSCLSPCSTCISATVCLTCLNTSLYYYANQCLANCPINSTIANSTSMSCDPCNPICLTCVNTTTTCLKCNITLAPFFVQQNQTCVSTCPYPLVADGINCVACQSPCVSCFVSKSNCLSCISGMFLSLVSNGSCLTKCQSQYFGNSTTNQCQSCSSVPSLHCKNCFNETICLICDTGFVFFPLNSTCLSQTPSGYVNISGIAVECTSNCSQCSSATYNCTACTGIFSLYSFAGTGYCQQMCPTSTLSFSNVCVTCTYPCKSCSISLNNCTECITGYLIQQNTSFVCTASCPSNTFLNLSICQNCSLPCLKCQSSPLYCISCSNSSFYLLNNSCVSICPNNSLVNQLTMSCYSCIHPCLTCSISINNCTSCVSGYYFYANTNQCLTSCPINITVSNSNGGLQCLPCDSNCTTCLTTTNNCLTCSVPYSFYNSSCLLSCPLGFFSGSNICAPCINNCLTCSSATICQTCNNPYLFYSSQCLSTCPVNSSIIVNKTCTACANNCLNCSISNICYECPANRALYNEACVTSCPSPLVIYFNTTNNKLSCFTSAEIAQQSLATTLKISSVLPLPFTIITAFIFLCCLMSKIQNIQTYLTGVGYSLYGCSQVGSFVYLLYIYKLGYSSSEDYSIYFLLSIITLGIIFLLNLISLTCVTPFLLSDPQFKNWLKMKRRGTPPKDTISYESNDDAQTTEGQGESENNQCCQHSTSFCSFTVLSFIVSYKFRFLIFTKLFNFKCLTAHLQNIHGFRAYNVLSFFGIVHESIVCYITIKFLMMFRFSDSQLYLATIDCLVVTITAFLFALISTQKDDNFFKVHNDFKDGIDLGRRKKDQDRLKNLKINDKRLKGMDSRDKLIDMNDSHTEVEEQIIVNHNIVGSSREPKQLGNWVPVDEDSRQRDIRSPRQKQYDNIFQLQHQEEDDKYRHMTDRERIHLFHTSVKPDRKKRKQQAKTAQSKLDEEIEVDMDQEPSVRFEKDSIKQKKKIIFDIQENQPEIIISRPHSKKLNLMPSTVKIDFSGREKREKQKEQQNISKKQRIIEKQNPIKNIKPASSHIEQIPVQNNLILVGQVQNLNQSMQIGQIQGSSQNKSFQSVLPFIHQDGILKEKRKPKQREASKQHLMIVSTKNQNQLNLIPSKPIEKLEQLQKFTPIIFSNNGIESVPSKRQNKIQEANEKNGNNLQQLLDLSDIRQEQKIVEQKPIITKVTQQIQVQQLEPKNIKKPTQTSVLPPKNTKFSFNSHINSHNYNKNKSPPKLSLTKMPITHKIIDQITNDPLVHAPKIYKSGKKLQINQAYNELSDFDEALIKRQQQLLRIREQLDRNNLLIAQKKAQDGVRSNKRSRSRQSIKSIIDQAIRSRRGEQKSKQRSINDEYNDDQSFENNEGVQNIQMNKINQMQNLSFDKRQSVEDDRSSKTIKKQMSRKQTEQILNNKRGQLQINSNVKSRISQKKNQSNVINQQYQNNYSQSKSNKQSSLQYAINIKQQNKISKQKERQIQSISYHPQIVQIQQEENKLVKVFNSQQQLQEKQQISIHQQSKIQQSYFQKSRENSKSQNIENIADRQNSQRIEQPSQIQQPNNRSNQRQQLNIIEPNSDQIHNHQNRTQFPSNKPNILQSSNVPTKQYLPLKFQKQLTTQKQEQQQESQQPSKPIQISYRNDYEVQQRDRPYQQQQNEENIISNQIRANFTNIFQQQQRDQPFEVEYDGGNLEGDEEFSRKQFTVENVDRQYLDHDAENGNSSQDKVNLSMRKTQKRPIRKKMPQEEPHQQISLQNQKFQVQSFIPSKQSETVRGIIKRNKNIEKIQQQQTGKDSKSNSQHVANLLKNITRHSRERRSMPKQQKDDRIRIKLQQNKFAKPSPQPQENTNLIRKSLEKNKPINQFKFENRQEEYSQDEQQGVNYRQPVITKQNTHLNFVKPSIPIDRSSSMRQSQPISKLKEKEISFAQRPQQILQKKEVNKEIRQFDFGDQFSSDRSKNQGYSQAQLVKWKHQFLRQGSYVNVQQEYQKSFQPKKPQIIHSSRFDEDQQGLEIIDQKRISRKKSRNSKSKHKKQSSGRKSQLHKIYGK